MWKLLSLLAVLSFMLTAATAEEVGVIHKKHVNFLVPRFNSTDPNDPDAYECLSARAPDYYGIGVRLGLYFSWCTAWLANAGMPNEVFMAQDQNAVFLFANVVALVRCTITDIVTQLDALVMIHLGMGSILSVLSTWGYRTCFYTTEGPQATRHFGGFGTHLRLLLSASISIFALWFWIHGVMPGDDKLLHDYGPCANVYTFMFGKVRADGPIRIFYIIMSVFWVVYYGIMILFSPIAGWLRLQRMIKLSRFQRWRTTDRLHIATGFNYLQLRYIFYALRAFNLFWIIWTMLTVEFILNYNHVVEVLGPGGRIYFPSQLIPMIIGAFTFCRLIYLKFEKIRGADVEPTVIEQPPLRGEPQPRPRGKDVLKLFSPPSGSSQQATTFVPPEDGDIDPRMAREHVWVRAIVGYLPWLSLLPRWNSDDFELDGHAGGPRPVKDAEKRAANLSDSDTLGGSPRAPEDRSKANDPLTFSPSIPPPDSSTYLSQDAQNESRNRFALPRFGFERRTNAST